MPRSTNDNAVLLERRIQGREGVAEVNDSFQTVGEEIERFRMNQVPTSKEKRNLHDLNSGTARKVVPDYNINFEKLINEQRNEVLEKQVRGEEINKKIDFEDLDDSRGLG